MTIAAAETGNKKTNKNVQVVLQRGLATCQCFRRDGNRLRLQMSIPDTRRNRKCW
jgi:hypothetical protein